MVFAFGYQTEISDRLLYKERLGNDKASYVCLPSPATYLRESSVNVLLVGMFREGINYQWTFHGTLADSSLKSDYTTGHTDGISP
jgi:hypothetical protein